MKKIPLGGKAGAGLFALVDNEDYPLLSRIKWGIGRSHAKNKRAGTMHSLIMGYPHTSRTIVIDHIDRDPLNNQKNNLRLTTQQVNIINRSGTSNGTSKYKGVGRYLNKRDASGRPWRSTICKTVNGKKMHFYLGNFATQKEAARAYDEKARELYGEFAVLNFPKH
jgi:hypothetical protein